jgi:hypothetical protein
MKIIFSRKGFDASTGKVPSPILIPSNRLCSLPIPEGSRIGKVVTRYRDIVTEGHSVGTMVHDLTKGKIKPESFAHLDPDLRSDSIPRSPDWKPVFGAGRRADSHLRNQGVGAGDIFLFFGWFRKVEVVDGKYQYIQNEPGWHVIFGWLQIQQRILTRDSVKTIP